MFDSEKRILGEVKMKKEKKQIEILIKKKENELKKLGMDFDVVTVPSNFELPVAFSMAASSETYEAFIVIGCDIKDDIATNNFISLQLLQSINNLAVVDSSAVNNVAPGAPNVEGKKSAPAT